MMTMKLPVILSAMIVALAVPATLGDTPKPGYEKPFDQGVAEIDGNPDKDLSDKAGPSVKPGEYAPGQHKHKHKKDHTED